MHSHTAAAARLCRVARVVSVLCAVPAARAAAQLPAPAVSAPVPLHVGGYASVVANAPDSSVSRARVSESSVALLASGTLLPRVGWFAELDVASSTRENYAGRQDDRVAELERLYVEYTMADALRLRVGRFLTPVGQWNESHAEPLTWTAVRPLATYRPFAKSATGVLLGGDRSVGGHDVGYALYGATGLGGRDGSEAQFSSALGARVAAELAPGAWLGVSGAALRQRRPVVAGDELDDDALAPSGVGDTEGAEELEAEDMRARALLGVDARLTVRGVELLGEAVHLGSDGASRARQQGAFVQLAIPLQVGGASLVGRTEWYSARPGSVVRLGMAGLTVRPRRWITLKLERELTTARTERVARGWHAGLSLLF